MRTKRGWRTWPDGKNKTGDKINQQINEYDKVTKLVVDSKIITLKENVHDLKLKKSKDRNLNVHKRKEGGARGSGKLYFFMLNGGSGQHQSLFLHTPWFIQQ